MQNGNWKNSWLQTKVVYEELTIVVRVVIHSLAYSIFRSTKSFLFFTEKGLNFQRLPKKFQTADLQMVVRRLKRAVEDNLKRLFSNKPSTACLITE